ncbi:MAG: acyl carrier protein [Armatimonadetes bacterium]|nr:MAG: acyl carrier protein [Armatimonadota bacterium]MCE7899183.1 acyl carrier protein [Armatimonadetes bacterium ATM1]MDL1928966.1 acyl carrier protein [Fimbriimonadia bacterium ATM]MBC6969479.1 acyl carrier protein [Armatimonadota bacterium]MBL1150601.1 acyl carrier protein [Armatimonadota bacterium]
MTQDEVLSKVKKVIESELGRKEEEISLDSAFVEDFGADSLDVVQLVMGFEDEFGIDIPDEDVEKMRTVRDAVEYISAKVEAGG